ncbi:hypothetical protein DL89DRAFT_268177 [Linderina pennispora]|uniref:Extracellular metalloproteinase n=1 Tax=Linderina pennispora TaxID=61395 RepID=A0A1Y1W6W7_9FUNG|nr:uncharacterized protein DL89DRAFT_268177 [Linderina pennispora]ORX69172.1 hypothetical protein DL89DRAFT_268177 [Linderina pennispora]
MVSSTPTALKLRASYACNTDVVLADYALARGMRALPYSTNMTTSPATYMVLRKEKCEDVHAVRLVRATVLSEVMWNFIEAMGLSVDLFEHGLSRGNLLFLQLLVDSLKLQKKTNPVFTDSQDALLGAKRPRTKGKNADLIVRGFGKRGL